MRKSIEPRSDRKVALEEILPEAAARMPQVSRARIRGNVLASVSVNAKPSFVGAAFMRAAAAFSALVIGMGGLSYAAASAVPGSVLYPVKRAMEETQVALILGDSGKADALQEMAEERVREMHRLIEMDGSRESMDKALKGFGDAAERAIEADPEHARQRASEIEESADGAPGPVRERMNEQEPGPTPGQESGSGVNESSQQKGSSGSESGSGAGSDSGDDSSPSGPSGGSGDSGSGKP